MCGVTNIMKIVSWNANGAFRNKYEFLLNAFKNAEQEEIVFVVQECENPEFYGAAGYKNALSNGFWVGDIKYKGMAVFSLNKNIRFEKMELNGLNDNKFFLPVKVNGKLNLVGVWTMKPYCECCFDMLTANKEIIDESFIFIGDFNSNVNLDGHHRADKTWGKCLEVFAEKGLSDIYHTMTGNQEGKEKFPTFFLQRHLEKPMHLDHCMAKKELVKSFKVHSLYKWLNYSDHLPIVVELKE